MIYTRIKLSDKQNNRYFLEYLKEGIADLLKEIYKRRSRREKEILAANLQELSARYKVDLVPKMYIKYLEEALTFTLKKGILVIQVSPKNRYYKLIKSIELGSYKIQAVPILGKVLAVMPFLLDKLYTDYEIVVDKLAYYKITDSVKYKLLTKYSLYSLSNKLNEKLKLL